MKERGKSSFFRLLFGLQASVGSTCSKGTVRSCGQRPYTGSRRSCDRLQQLRQADQVVVAMSRMIKLPPTHHQPVAVLHRRMAPSLSFPAHALRSAVVIPARPTRHRRSGPRNRCAILAPSSTNATKPSAAPCYVRSSLLWCRRSSSCAWPKPGRDGMARHPCATAARSPKSRRQGRNPARHRALLPITIGRIDDKLTATTAWHSGYIDSSTSGRMIPPSFSRPE